MTINKIFRPPLPIEPSVIDFDDLKASVKYLKQSANWYRAYADYLENLTSCKSFEDCLKASVEINWNRVQNGKFVKESNIEY